jgi:hypothetical protein
MSRLTDLLKGHLERATGEMSENAAKTIRAINEIDPVDKAGDKAGVKAGDKAGDKAGVNAGDKAGVNAGVKAGVNAGDKAGVNAGVNAGVKAGVKAGDKAGDKAGVNAGDNAGDKAGVKAGDKAGVKAEDTTTAKPWTRPRQSPGHDQGKALDTTTALDEQIAHEIHCLKHTQKVILHAIYKTPLTFGIRYCKATDLANIAGITYRNITRSIQRYREQGWIKTAVDFKKIHMGNQITEIHPAVEKYLQKLPADYSDIPATSQPKSLLKNKNNNKVSFFEKDSENLDENENSETSKSKDDFWTEFRSDPRYDFFDHFFPNFAQWNFGLQNIESALKQRKFLPKTPEKIWEEIDRLYFFANSPTMREKTKDEKYKGKEAGFLFACFRNNQFQTPDYLSQIEIQKIEIEKWEKKYVDLQTRLQKMEDARKHEKILQRLETLDEEQVEHLRAVLLLKDEDSTELILQNRHLDRIQRMAQADPNFWDNL